MKLFSYLISAFLIAALPALSAESLGDFIFHHIGNADKWHPIWFVTVPLPSHLDVFGINMGITLHVLMFFIAALVLIILLSLASKRKNSVPVSRWGHAIEAIVVYIRYEIVVPNIGKKDAAKWLPFFLTLFFFILTLNLLGLVPGMSTATANINCTAALAIMTFLVFNIAGMMKNGPVKYFVNLVPKGIPFPIIFILAPVELLGLFTKGFALAIRLFANMSAGHIVILSLLALISIFKSYWVSPVSVGFSLFISLIEILVAFLQAYVFTLLASLFIGMALHQEH
jgi:F-type H+-transporting ATPase subunit a